MQFSKRYLILVLLALALFAAASPLVTAQFAPAGTVQSGGFTRTYQQSSVGGTFIPPQTQVSETFYSYPGISPYGAYPGGGYAYNYGVGPTPYGYGPYGGFTYL